MLFKTELKVFTSMSFLILGLVIQKNAYGFLQEDREPEAATGISEKQSVRAKNFMVVAANPYASRIGYNILKKGGSAIDAAIAVQLTLTLVEPQSSGIGGGAFILHWDNKNTKLKFQNRKLNARKMFLYYEKNNIARKTFFSRSFFSN